ncbi:CubicO group peptidase (beta-lactamase class C family) [Algoriphagus sp. 4150]|uniref:serine hydrolase domain-containing protein n=1 Tax=Algoriphagus sp. 4150 TaxID=2817756 RepID=UPI0028588070|nr:serine hydrolase domain-containing protein [Algoriphagus sp. 4150]MDR7129325.1 CubicO group peptidase (beta-lactamase class C family) [Algoriphagus sp. 4150]
MKIHFPLFILLFLISFFSKGQGEKQYYSALASKIDSIVQGSNFNGVVLLTVGNEAVFHKAKGYSNFEDSVLMEKDDQFVIGSISKQITAVMVLREYEKGKLNLNDEIGKYLPSIDQSWSKRVTIHHLLTHTHGIVDVNQPLEFEQGSQFNYSQLGYELLARILENITGNSFEELSTQLFLESGLSNTVHPENKQYKSLVKGYEESENGILEYATNSLVNHVAAGAFISNAEDLSRWNYLLYSGRLVGKESLELMKTRYATRIHPIFGQIEYGYGLLFNLGEENIQIGALGYAPGFASACYYYPETDLSIIVLENAPKHLDDIKKTFKIHTQLMEVVKEESLPTQNHAK